MRIRFRRNQAASQARNPRKELADRFPDVAPPVLDTLHAVSAYTMTSPERLIALCDAIGYLVHHRIAGAIVECGVWRGGSMMAAARTLVEFGAADRDLWLYDTFDGMSQPGTADIDWKGAPAERLLAEQDRAVPQSVWCLSPLDEVRRNLAKTTYPGERIHYIQGKVEDTIPARLPHSISLLRLDTDWYQSTAHELEHLWPRLVPGGVLIVDDYGHWQGCRRAVDEYFEKHRIPVCLCRIDYTGRIAIKPASFAAPISVPGPSEVRT